MAIKFYLLLICSLFFRCNNVSNNLISESQISANLITNINKSKSFISNHGFDKADSKCVSLMAKIYKDSLFFTTDSLLYKTGRTLLIKPNNIAVMDFDTTFIEISYVFIDESNVIYENKDKDYALIGFGVSQNEIKYSINRRGIKHLINNQ